MATNAVVASGVVPHEEVVTLHDAVRAELALIRAEDARAVLRAQTLARVHTMQAERARARLALHH
jgi:hypothetical protein